MDIKHLKGITFSSDSSLKEIDKIDDDLIVRYLEIA